MVTTRSRRTLRVWLISGVLVAILISLASCASATTTPAAPTTQPGGGAGPRLSIDKPVADFGKAVYDQMVQPMWTLTNSGTAPLQIRDFKLDVKEGC